MTKDKNKLIGGVFDKPTGPSTIITVKEGKDSGKPECVFGELKIIFVEHNGEVRLALGITMDDNILTLAKKDEGTMAFLLALPDAIRNYLQTELGIS